MDSNRMLTENPPLPRFNGWRLGAMAFMLFAILVLIFAGLFVWDIKSAKINLAEYYLLSRGDNKEVAALHAQVRRLQSDTANLRKKLRLLERGAGTTALPTNSLRLVSPFTAEQKSYKSFGAWAVAGMRYYRDELNSLYKEAGIQHKIK